MPRTIQVEETQYRWPELSETAKQNAIATYWSEYDSASDALASLKGFAEHFGSKLRDWSIDWGNCSHSSVEFSEVDELEPEELERLVAALRTDGGCQFTGYCMDDACNDGAVAAYKAGERDVDAILQAGFETWLKQCQEDFEYQTKDETVAENCEANDYWFDVHGNIV